MEYISIHNSQKSKVPVMPDTITVLPDESGDVLLELLETLLDDLAPLFVRDPDRLQAGRRLALHAILAYHPRNEADCLSAAQIVAHARMSLALMREATDPATPQAMRVRMTGRAQSLSRSAAQVEAVMERRRKRREADAKAEAEAASAAAPDLLADGPDSPRQDPEFEAMLQAVSEMVANGRAPIASTPVSGATTLPAAFEDRWPDAAASDASWRDGAAMPAAGAGPLAVQTPLSA